MVFPFIISFSLNTPVSLYDSLKGVNLVPPDMFLIASIWTFSKILIKLMYKRKNVATTRFTEENYW